MSVTYPSHRCRRRLPARCRGAVYLMVLVSSAIVMVVGVSALMAMRIEHHAAAGASRAADARVHARSAVELALLRISNDPNWRTTYTHDQWSDDIAFDGALLRFKLVDAAGSDLAVDSTSRVWLYGHAVDGQIERTTRVLLAPASQLPGANLLRNPYMRHGGRHWRTDDSDAELRYTTADAHHGDGSLYLRHRATPEADAIQDVTDRIESGITYELSAWVRMPDTNDHMVFELYARDTSNGEQRYAALGDKVAGNSWRHVSATITPQWDGTLLEATWRLHTLNTSAELFIDETTLIPVTHGHHMVPVPGTWERVVNH